MTEEEIIEAIKKSPNLQDFVRNDRASVSIKVCGVPIVIYKEDVGGAYYYKVPYDSRYNYEGVEDFMKIAIPKLEKEIEHERELYRRSPACINIKK